MEDLGLDPPSGLYSGDGVVVHWQDANTGNGATSGPWDDRVVVRNTTTGQTLSTVSLEYDTATLGAVVPGGAAGQQYAFTLPAGKPSLGTIQFTVTTDVLNQIFEYNSAGTAESNNTATISAVSALMPAADLQVANLGLSPATGLQSGNDVVLSWDDVNKWQRRHRWPVGQLGHGHEPDDRCHDLRRAPSPTTPRAPASGPSARAIPSPGTMTSRSRKATRAPAPLRFTVVVDSTRSIADYTTTGAVDPRVPPPSA